MTSEVNNENSAADDGPLTIFPEEVWEIVLNQINRSQDVFNFFKAFPQLDKIFHNKKPNVLFDLVLPHIMTKYLVRKQKHLGKYHWYLQSKELLNLRLVSKRWKHAVEWCIQNHSDHQPPLPKSQTDIPTNENNVLPEHHFSYNRMNKYHLGATIFREVEQIEKFMEEMENYDGNPFPGKFVYCNFHKTCNLEALPFFVPKLVEMLQKFGKFVHLLDFEILDNRKCNWENFRTILNGLSFVPNLRSLTIRGKLHATNDRVTNNYFGHQPESQKLFPKLPYLKIFDWQVYSEEDSSWVRRMIDMYTNQNNCLRKLAIDVYCCNDLLVSRLKYVSELHLYLDSSKENTVNKIKNVLSLFPFGQLRKFGLSGNPENRSVDKDIKELLEIIGEFHIEAVVLERLRLRNWNTGYRKEKSETFCTKTSTITSLWFDDNRYLTLDFLKVLQNLKFLHIYSDDYDSYSQFNRDVFTNYLCSYYSQAGYIGEDLKIDIPENFSIWEELPKLEILSTSIQHTSGILDVQYAREYGNRPFLGYRPAKKGKYGNNHEK